jgi:pyridinium-3,5-biscarboxylic acid mononucleotide synthase
MKSIDLPYLRHLVEQVARREVGTEAALRAIQQKAFEDLGFAKLDHHRLLRHGFPEVVFCAGKTPPQVREILFRLDRARSPLLATRASRAHYQMARRAVKGLRYHPVARAIWKDPDKHRVKRPGVVVMTAGTADIPVAEEAALTLEMMGHSPKRIYDVGVAGIHRLFDQVTTLQNAHALVVVAGMEGALPSVVGGLVRVPIIAVPTSVGYGASFGGVAALLAMLNSCAPGISLVNIDNGFGAGCIAARINALYYRNSDRPVDGARLRS